MSAVGERETPRSRALRILMIEDEAWEAELAKRHLAQAGMSCTITVVDTQRAFEQQLTLFRPDVILSDFSVPGFSGESALKLAVQQQPRVPFIFYSGILGDERAVELIRQGATDFVLKDHAGVRLPSVIQRALSEADQRAQVAALEAELNRTRHLASISRLAAGIAHELNNQVGAMLGLAEIIRGEAIRRAESDSGADGWQAVGADAGKIDQVGRRVLRLVNQLLAIGGHQRTRPEPMDVHQTVTAAEELLRSTLGARVTVRVLSGGSLWPVLADPARIHDALLELAMNAGDAMPDGGTLSVQTRNVTLTADEASAHAGLAAGDYVCLTVSDTGHGMTPESVERAFEPFFHDQAVRRGRRARAGERGGRGETILLVEDEEILADIVYRLLVRNGYRVCIATAPGDALRHAMDLSQPIDLLLTDAVMPKMLGNEVATRVRAVRPGLPVLFMSGYAQPVLDSQGALDPDIDLLEKPFSEATLLIQVHRALHGESGSGGRTAPQSVAQPG